MPGQTFACARCGTEKVLVASDPGLDPEDKWKAHPETGAQTLRSGCELCGGSKHYAVGRAAGSILALNRRLSKENERTAGSAASDGGGATVGTTDTGSDTDQTPQTPDLSTEVGQLIAEIQGSGEERVREMLETEIALQDEPRKPIVAAANTRLLVIRGDLDPDEADYPTGADADDESDGAGAGDTDADAGGDTGESAIDGHPKEAAIRRCVDANPDAEPRHVLVECDLPPEMRDPIADLLATDPDPESDADSVPETEAEAEGEDNSDEADRAAEAQAIADPESAPDSDLTPDAPSDEAADTDDEPESEPEPGAETATCPACESEVDSSALFGAGQCPACGSLLTDMLESTQQDV